MRPTIHADFLHEILAKIKLNLHNIMFAFDCVKYTIISQHINAVFFFNCEKIKYKFF